MLKSTKDNKGYYADIQLPVRRKVTFKIDTGSPVTIMSISDIARMLFSTVADIRNKLNKFKRVDFTTYSGGKVSLCPVYIRNVSVEGLSLDILYAFVNIDVDESTNLIGMDFLSACDFDHYRSTEAITIYSVDPMVYYSNFKKAAGEVEVQEILEIVKNETDVQRSRLSELLKKAEK